MFPGCQLPFGNFLRLGYNEVVKQTIILLTLWVCVFFSCALAVQASPALWAEVAALEKSGDDIAALERIDRGRSAIIKRLIDGLQERPIKLLHHELCREVNSRRKPIPLPAPLRAGEDICLFLQVSDFTVKKHNRSYIHHLLLEIAVKDANGQVVLPVQPVRQHVAGEVFSGMTDMVKYVSLPLGMPAGHYQLEFLVSDRLTPGKTVRGKIDFHVGGMNPTGH